MDNEDWPRLTDEPYTSEEIKAYSEHIYDTTGKEIQLNPSGNYYNIDYDKLSKYVKVPTNKENYILQNPVGKVFYMDKLTEAGKDRVDYANGSVPSEPEEPIETPLYEYTSATFTNAGATGLAGPTQDNLDKAYLGSVLEGKVVSNAGIQLWTVPKSGTYRIEAYGAQGGSSLRDGGKGAIIKGDYNLKINGKLKIAVGQEGGDSPVGAGGGGGTFILAIDNSEIAIAGAGGGGTSYNQKGDNASNTINGSDSYGLNLGGKNGLGGQVPKQGVWSGAAGAGLLGNGENGGSSSSAKGGYTITHGLLGGNQGSNNHSNNSYGGFGGGGAGTWAPGGGGGYSGGAGGYSMGYETFGGGGGGSFNSGENQVNSVGNAGHGKVVITYIGE